MIELRDIKIVMHQEFEGTGRMDEEEFFIPYSLIEKAYKTEREWSAKDNILKIHITKAKFLEIDKYDYKGNYLHFDKNRVENWNVEFDNSGIPKTKYSYGKYYNPSTIAHYGLQHYSLYLINKNIKSKENFMKTVNWFIQNQDSRGGWAYGFDLPFYPKRLKKLLAPWYSAIGLGMAMSVLSRATSLTGDGQYATAALKANNIFKTPAENNGILAKFENKFFFYEECPTNPPSFILNGFMYSLIGLYDLYKATNNSETFNLYKKGILTLKRMIALYDLGNRTAYDLTHYTTDGGYPNVAKWGYHITHIHLLAAINSIEKDKKLNDALVRWKEYLIGKVKYV